MRSPTSTHRYLSIKSLSSLVLVFGTSMGHALDSKKPSPSDLYCQHLESALAEAYRTSSAPNPLNQFFSFINSLTEKVSLKTIEQEAIGLKKSFEDFQKYAADTYQTKVYDHYRPQYIEAYKKQVCGEITSEASFSNTNPDHEIRVTAEKQFDPLGHPSFQSR